MNCARLNFVIISGCTVFFSGADVPRLLEKGGLSFRGVSQHDGFGGFDCCGGSGEYLALLLLLLQLQDKEATVTALTVWPVSVVLAVSVITATPLKLNPSFRHPALVWQLHKGMSLESTS